MLTVGHFRERRDLERLARVGPLLRDRCRRPEHWTELLIPDDFAHEQPRAALEWIRATGRAAIARGDRIWPEAELRALRCTSGLARGGADVLPAVDVDWWSHEHRASPFFRRETREQHLFPRNKGFVGRCWGMGRQSAQNGVAPFNTCRTRFELEAQLKRTKREIGGGGGARSTHTGGGTRNRRGTSVQSCATRRSCPR